MTLKNRIFNLVESNIGIFLFFFFFIILFRDFLYDYRAQLEVFWGYYPYQKQIIFYLTGDKYFDVEAPMNLRFLGLWTQYLIYKIVPCIELTKVNISPPYQNYTCATFSNAFMNYLSLCGILAVSFCYSFKKLNLNLVESILTVFLTYIYINHLEAYTLDRISVLYFVITLYFLDKRLLCIILILLGSIVNEKIIFILAGLFFIRFFFNKKKEYFNFFVTALVSALLVVGIFLFYSIILDYGYYQSEGGMYNTALSRGLDRIFSIFLSKSGISNGALPLMFALTPYFLSFVIRTEKFYYSKIDIFIPLSLLIFSAGGGMEQTGRYVMYSMPLWLPIFSQQILFLISKAKKNV